MTTADPSPTHQMLRTLCLIRLIPLGGQTLTALYLFLFKRMTLPWLPISLLLSLFVVQIIYSWWRSKQSASISDREFFAQLVADIILFGLLLYFTGGATNPFISYFLVPLTIAAITLPWRYTLMISTLSLAAYSLLLFWFVKVPDLLPIHSDSHSGASELNIHIVGMWVNFLTSALLITWFVTQMADAVRHRDEALVRQQTNATEQRLQDEQLLAVATLAASAVHDLGTPLNTVKLIIDDWRHGDDPSPAGPCNPQEVEIIAQQIQRCTQTLKKLGNTARAFSQQEVEATPLRQYFTHLLDRWLLMRPDVDAHLSYGEGDGNPLVYFHPALAASIHNILNNAADASPHWVGIHIGVTDDRVRLSIRDHGPGIDPARITGNHLGSSDKADGLGLGLFLSRSILARHGATLAIHSDAEGTLAIIELPLHWDNGGTVNATRRLP